MQRRHARGLCWAVIAVGAVAALAAARCRLGWEAADRTVAVVLDHEELRRLAIAGGIGMPETLRRMKAAGATGVALTEQTLREALSGGDLVAAPPRPGEAPDTVTLVGSPAVIARMRRSLEARIGPGRRAVEAVPEPQRLTLAGVRLTELADLGIGYPEGAAEQIDAEGLEVVARPRAEDNQWARASMAALSMAQQTGAKLVIFAGNATLGYPENLAGVAEAIRSFGFTYGLVEFGNQFGDVALGARLAGRVVRVHSISETEMLGMTPRRALDRLVLGVRERNIRVCYARLFAPGGTDPLAAAEGYVRSLAEELRSRGFTLGSPQPLPDAQAATLLRRLSGVGALAAAGLCLLELLGSRIGLTLIGLAAAGALFVVGSTVAPGPALKGAALLATLALPTLAVARLGPDGAARSRWPALGRGLMLFASTSGMSALGGLLVVGCLADARFPAKLDQFAGVKLAHVVPLLAVLLLQVGWDLGRPEAGEGEAPLGTLIRGWRSAAFGLVRYWHAALLAVCLVGIGLMVLRSGNDAGPGVPGFELAFRSVLNRVFGVRPRTKEILIGHPLLILALARAAGGKNVGRWLLLGLGTIGQVSLVNTFTHLHTPLAVSVARTLHGLWLGTAIGVALYLIVEWVERRLTAGAAAGKT